MKSLIIFAYLDPGSGSLVLQMVVGAIAASLFAIKAYWLKITGFFSRKRDNSSDKPKS